MVLLYSFAIRCYFILLQVVSIFNSRAKQFVKSRKIDSLIGSLSVTKPLLWIHCASHGEFETAIPIIVRYRSTYHIHITFYSPSGYQFAKHSTEHWDTIEYLPLDTSENAKNYVDKIRPKAVIFIQYEFWYHFLSYLIDAKIPMAFYGTTFSPDYFLFKPYMSFIKQKVNASNLILVKDEKSLVIAKKQFDCEVIEAGEVRWLTAIKNKQQVNTDFKVITSETKVVILASVWEEDLEILKNSIEELAGTYHFILAPHDLSTSNFSKLEVLVPFKSVKRSDKTIIDISKPGITWLNTLGELKYLYQYASLSYIGGGFGAGLHNCIEAAVFQNPLLFGGNISSNSEANSLIEHGFARHVQSDLNLTSVILELLNTDFGADYGTYIDTEIEKCSNVYSALDNFLN